MTALVFLAFAAHVIAWIVLPHSTHESARVETPVLGHAAAGA